MNSFYSSSFTPVETERYLSQNDGKEYILYKYPSGKRLFFISVENGFHKYHTGAYSKEEAIHRLEEYISKQKNADTDQQYPDVKFVCENDEINSQNITATARHIAKGMLNNKCDLTFAPRIIERLRDSVTCLGKIYAHLADLIEACAVLEVRGVKNLAKREIRTPIKAIEDTLAAMRKAHEEENADEFARADIEFHFQLIQADTNTIATEIHQALQPLLYQYAKQAAQDPHRQLTFISEHTAIYSAIQRGDAKEAATLMALHTFQCMGHWEMWQSQV